MSEANGPGSSSTAARQTSPPKECPIRCTRSPSSAATARTWAPSAGVEYAARSSGPGDSNCPGRSIATARRPAACSGANSGPKSSLLPVNPGTISTGTPSAGPARNAAIGPCTPSKAAD